MPPSLAPGPPDNEDPTDGSGVPVDLQGKAPEAVAVHPSHPPTRNPEDVAPIARAEALLYSRPRCQIDSAYAHPAEWLSLVTQGREPDPYTRRGAVLEVRCVNGRVDERRESIPTKQMP